MSTTWPIQVAKDANIRIFAIRKVHSGEKTKSIATQTSAEEIRCVTDGSTQPSEQNPGTEMDDQGTVCGGPTWALLEAHTVKNLPAVQETQVRSLGWEDPLEKGMATHSSILAWRIPWSEEPGRLYSPWGRKESDTTERLTPAPTREAHCDVRERPRVL